MNWDRGPWSLSDFQVTCPQVVQSLTDPKVQEVTSSCGPIHYEKKL